MSPLFPNWCREWRTSYVVFFFFFLNKANIAPISPHFHLSTILMLKLVGCATFASILVSKDTVINQNFWRRLLWLGWSLMPCHLCPPSCSNTRTWKSCCSCTCSFASLSWILFSIIFRRLVMDSNLPLISLLCKYFGCTSLANSVTAANVGEMWEKF